MTNRAMVTGRLTSGGRHGLASAAIVMVAVTDAVVDFGDERWTKRTQRTCGNLTTCFTMLSTLSSFSPFSNGTGTRLIHIASAPW